MRGTQSRSGEEGDFLYQLPDIRTLLDKYVRVARGWCNKLRPTGLRTGLYNDLRSGHTR